VHDAAVSRIEREHRERVASIESTSARELATADDTRARDWSAFERDIQVEERDLSEHWTRGRERLESELSAIESESGDLVPSWSRVLAPDWSPVRGVPGGMRFGEMPVDLGRHVAIEKPLSAEAGLAPFSPSRFDLPALAPFPHRGSLLFHANDAGRNASIAALQAIMLRYLTALPPGKVRFTIIDPVGLGENFAAFMHLADHDEQLVTSRIWTEPSHIERRLSDLTGHMENVIQKYLRNQYRSIEEYNAQAGEVAEPYRVLVVANFPANFSAETARRLVSVAQSGASCGVFVLASVDSKQSLPQGFELGDLEQACVNLSWSDGRFVWEDSDFGNLPLQIDAPPKPTELARIVLKIGEAAIQASKVEVDFGFIEPAREAWWTSDSRKGIRVPLGRAGATKRQHLHLGIGTAQHALVAGKTGSGKSTLLHALITNLASRANGNLDSACCNGSTSN
jgi:hypothetical protein